MRDHVGHAALRDRVIEVLRTVEHVIVLGCGTRSLRFRPALTVTEAELALGVAALDRVLAEVGSMSELASESVSQRLREAPTELGEGVR